MGEEQEISAPEQRTVACSPSLTNNIVSWKACARDLFAAADEAHGLTRGPNFASAKAFHIQQPELERQLWRFLRDMTTEVRGKIVAVRLILNDYAQSLGIGLVSAKSELLDENGDTMERPGEEEAALTIGSVLPPMPLRAQVLARFNVSAGAEELTPVAGNLHGRTYARGERMCPLKDEPSLRSADGVIYNEEPLIVPMASSVAISVPVLDPDALRRSGLEYMEILPERDPNSERSVLYVCRYRTHKSALRESGYKV